MIDPVLIKFISESIKQDIELSDKLRQMPEYRVHAGFSYFVDSLHRKALKLSEDMFKK